MTNAITNDRIATLIAQVKERDAKLVAQAQKRCEKFYAFVATNRAIDTMNAMSVDADALFKRCDKTRDRFVRVLDALINDTITPKNESDQNRYTFNLMRTLIASVNANAKLVKADILATATKREDANEFVTVSRRIMQDSTAERQSGIAIMVLETLGFITRTKTENNVMQVTVNKKSACYRLAVKLIAREATA